jgi:hypothetical protein
VAISIPGGYGEAEGDAGVLTIASCSSDPGGGHVGAGEAPGGRAGDHPHPPCHWLHRGVYRRRHHVPLPAPHRTISDMGVIGGGQLTIPGEVSLAHHGILLLDELPACTRHGLEGLRQPVEKSVM